MGTYTQTLPCDAWKGDRIKHFSATLDQCKRACDTEDRCKHINYHPPTSECELLGPNFNTCRADNEWQGFDKASGPNTNNKIIYEGAPLDMWNADNFSIDNNARRPVTPNTNGRGSCGGFNGYGGWRGWDMGFGYMLPGNACPERFDLGMCTTLGKVKTGSYVNSPTGNLGILTTKCNYYDLDWPKLIVQNRFDEEKGKKLLTPGAWIQAKNDYCADWTNIDKQECTQWLQPSNQGSASYNTVKMGLCSGRDWSTETRCVNAINQVFKTGSDSEKNVANQMVITLCGSNPNSNACACYNATNRTTEECLRTPDLPGCKSIADKVGKYKTLGATFMTTAIKPFCACDECTEAKTGSAGKIISQPAADQPGLCTDKINACFQQVTVGTMSGGNLQAGCTIQDITQGAPPGTVSTPAASSPPPPPPSGASGASGAASGGSAAAGTGGSAAAGAAGAAAGGVASDTATSSTMPASKKKLIIGLSIGGFFFFLLVGLGLYLYMSKQRNAAK